MNDKLDESLRKTLFYIQGAMKGLEGFSFNELNPTTAGYRSFRFEHLGVGVRFEISSESEDAHMFGYITGYIDSWVNGKKVRNE